MSLTEVDQEEYDRNRFNEGKEAGIAEGKRDTALQNARNFKYKIFLLTLSLNVQGFLLNR